MKNKTQCLAEHSENFGKEMGASRSLLAFTLEASLTLLGGKPSLRKRWTLC